MRTPDLMTAFGEDAFGGRAPHLSSCWRRPARPDRDKVALDQLEEHRSEAMQHMQEREKAIKTETDELKALLTANAKLTQQDKDLTARIEALTREIHARLPAA